jgi:hypothetical protein
VVVGSGLGGGERREEGRVERVGGCGVEEEACGWIWAEDGSEIVVGLGVVDDEGAAGRGAVSGADIVCGGAEGVVGDCCADEVVAVGGAAEDASTTAGSSDGIDCFEGTSGTAWISA